METLSLFSLLPCSLKPCSFFIYTSCWLCLNHLLICPLLPLQSKSWLIPADCCRGKPIVSYTLCKRLSTPDGLNLHQYLTNLQAWMNQGVSKQGWFLLDSPEKNPLSAFSCLHALPASSISKPTGAAKPFLPVPLALPPPFPSLKGLLWWPQSPWIVRTISPSHGQLTNNDSPVWDIIPHGHVK